MMALLVWEPPLFSQEATGRRDACRRTCDKSRGGGRPDRAFREGKVYQIGWPGRDKTRAGSAPFTRDFLLQAPLHPLMISH